MLSPRFPHHSLLTSALLHHGLLAFVTSPGAYSLPHTGGVSSSAALTGAVSMALSHLLSPAEPWTRETLASVDYGEYYLGKFAGCADKMAQLFAQRSTVTVIQSKPERFLSSLHFPHALALLIAESDMPRLTVPAGRTWLQAQGLPAPHVDTVVTWARAVMVRFGSLVYCRAGQLIVDTVEARAGEIGVTEEEARAVRQALLGHRMSGEKALEGRDGPLLRELCAGGLIEEWLPALAGWEQRLHRYALIFKLLLLLPVHLPHTHQGEVYDLCPRKAALYGISEVERGTAYLRELARLDALGTGGAEDGEVQASIARVMRYVELSHNGDKAVVDFRLPANPAAAHPSHLSRHDAPFTPAPWAKEPATSLSDEVCRGYAVEGADLLETVGSYERSVVNVDEVCDEMREKWGGVAAARISAAGMGGRLGIHCKREVMEDVREWLEKRGWKCRQPRPGAPTQHVSFDAGPSSQGQDGV